MIPIQAFTSRQTRRPCALGISATSPRSALMQRRGMVRCVCVVRRPPPDIPPPSDPPPRDPLDYRRWAKWERCVRHAIDFMTFEFPLLTTEQIHAYLDALPDLPGQGESGPTFSARLRAVANPDDPTTLHAWLFTPDGRAPLGSYFGTVPGSVREP